MGVGIKDDGRCARHLATWLRIRAGIEHAGRFPAQLTAPGS